MALEEGEKNVTELVNAVQTTQANVSRHLAALTAGGLLSRRKQGSTVCYSIAERAIFKLCEHVCGSLQARLARQRAAVKTFGG